MLLSFSEWRAASPSHHEVSIGHHAPSTWSLVLICSRSFDCACIAAAWQVQPDFLKSLVSAPLQVATRVPRQDVPVKRLRQCVKDSDYAQPSVTAITEEVAVSKTSRFTTAAGNRQRMRGLSACLTNHVESRIHAEPTASGLPRLITHLSEDDGASHRSLP